MADPVTLKAVASTLKKPLEDLYSLGKSRFQSRLEKWRAAKNVNNLYDRIFSIQKVKTIWQIDKEVNLKQFYYPSKVIIDEKRMEINKLSKLPDDTNIVIRGTVGQGKSIFLRYLCSQEIRIGKNIPIFIELRKIGEGTNIKDLLFSTLNAWGFNVDEDLFDFFAKSGKFYILADGFDEIGSSFVKDTITQLENWSEKYQSLRIVVTSRPDSGIDRSTYFRVFNLAPLAQEDQQGIVYTLTKNNQQRDSIVNSIKQSPSDIKGLLTTPLMMTLLVVVYKSTQKIPEQFSEFYEDLFQTLLIRHDKSKPGYFRERHCNINERRLQEIFEAFCFFASKEDLTTMKFEKIHSLSNEAISTSQASCDSASFIHDITKICCLVIQEGFDYHFVHKSVREFYTANFIKNRNENFSIKFYSQMVNGKWENWIQELSFLAKIDEYRFSEHFLRPHFEEIAAAYDIDLSKEDDQTITVENVIKSKDFRIHLDPDSYLLAGINYSGKYIHNFPNTFEPINLCVRMVVPFHNRVTPERQSLTEHQRLQIEANATRSSDGEHGPVISGLKYIEIIGVKEQLDEILTKSAKAFVHRYAELMSFIKKEEEKVKILDLDVH